MTEVRSPWNWLLGPEAVLVVFTLGLFAVCARHGSGEGRDLRLIEQLIWWLPFVIALVAFATAFVPGALSVSWLGRTILASFIALLVCGGRLIAGLGEGAKGQDAAFILLIALGAVAVGLGTALSVRFLLPELSPALGGWLQAHPALGWGLTMLSVIPIAIVLGFAATVCVGIGLGMYVEVFKR